MNESIFKDQKYYIGLLTGIILAAIVTVGYDRYLEYKFFTTEGEDVEKSENIEKSENSVVVNGQEISITKKAQDLENNFVKENIGGTIKVPANGSPETPHSPELQRLDLILREAGRMLERMDKDIVKINGTQTATVNQ